MEILFSNELTSNLLLINSFLIELRIFSSINNDILYQLSGFYVLLIDSKFTNQIVRPLSIFIST